MVHLGSPVHSGAGRFDASSDEGDLQEPHPIFEAEETRQWLGRNDSFVPNQDDPEGLAETVAHGRF